MGGIVFFVASVGFFLLFFRVVGSFRVVVVRVVGIFCFGDSRVLGLGVEYNYIVRGDGVILFFREYIEVLSSYLRVSSILVLELELGFCIFGVFGIGLEVYVFF